MRILRILLIALLLAGLPSTALAWQCPPWPEQWASIPNLTFGRVVSPPQAYEMEWQTYLTLKGSAPERLTVRQPNIPLENDEFELRMHWLDMSLMTGDWAILGFVEADDQYYYPGCTPRLTLPPWLLTAGLIFPAVLILLVTWFTEKTGLNPTAR